MSKKISNTIQKYERVPIVTILGHVDHGKTTILDNIRKSNVQSCEAGGITQKVSAFTVNVKDNKKITFIDTPGHEAFDLMRSRGGSIADIVLLIVAADDGVQPQTKESIEIIKRSTAKPIVVINKVDLPDVDIPKIKREIVNNGLQIEGLGGDIPVIEVSGKTGKGISELLDLILLVAEVEGLQERDTLPAGVLGKAFVLESIKDRSMGNVSTIVLIQGEICEGNIFGYRVGKQYHMEKVKGVIAEEGKEICLLNNGCGGKVMGISNLLELGTEVFALEEKNEKLLRSLYKDASTSDISQEESFDDFFGDTQNSKEKSLGIIVKSSSEGSLEALKNALQKINEDGYTANIIQSGVGNITLQDVEMASMSKAILLGFEVNVESGVSEYAKKSKVLIRTYDIIYKLLEEVEDVISMMSLPQEAEEEIGKAKVRVIFVLSDGSRVFGSRVESGIMKKDCRCDLVRNDEIIGEAKIKSLRINKDSVNEAKTGFDCGILFDKELDAKEGDEVYCYKVMK
jgi:translation initiation factor IF-2